MIKSFNILFWVSGLSLGLMVCAFFACPHWKVVVPVMLFIAVVTGVSGFKKTK